MQLKGLEESIYQKRNTRASRYSHQFCRKLCCDIASHLTVRRNLMVDTTDKQSPFALIDRSHAAYPAELDDEESQPQTLPLAPDVPTDPLQQLRDLNTDTLRIGDTNIKLIVDVLNQQLLKASILTLIDYMTKFGLPGQPSSRLFVNPTQPGEPEHIGARTLINIFKDYFTTHAMLAQTYPKRLQILPDRDYSNPHDHYHRLRIWHDRDGRTVILMD